MRVLLFSKAAIRAAYHQQYAHIAAHPQIHQLQVVVPPFWREPRVGKLPAEVVTPQNYQLAVTSLRFNGQYHLYYAPKLPKLIRQFQPDLVHLDEEVYNFATVHATWFARQAGARVVAFCWQNIYRRYPPPFCWFERLLARWLSGVVAGNTDALEVLQRKGFRTPMCVIPQFGVDTNTFTPGKTEPLPPFRIGYLGRLVAAKGIDVLVESLQWLPSNYELWIAGEGDPTPWQKLATRQGLSPRIRWIGAVPSLQVVEFLRHVHVLVLPSRTTPSWKEQFGRVLVEAMACGVPVVGSDSGEIPHVIGDGGLVFPEGDAQRLAECILSLCEQADTWREVSRRARHRAVQHFSIAQVANRYVQFWSSLRETPPTC